MMSDHANDALWASIEEELFLDENRGHVYEDGWGRQPHHMLDSGTFDLDSLSKEIQILSLQLDANTDNCNFRSLEAMTFPPLFKLRCKKYLPAMKMRLGMANQLMNNHHLSLKQLRWLETNWKGGSIAFVEAFTKHKDKEKMVRVLKSVVMFMEKMSG